MRTPAPPLAACLGGERGLFAANLRRRKPNIYDSQARRCFQKPKPAGASGDEAAAQLGLFVSRCRFLSLREDESGPAHLFFFNLSEHNGSQWRNPTLE